jgi:hypothetical protein
VGSEAEVGDSEAEVEVSAAEDSEAEVEVSAAGVSAGVDWVETGAAGDPAPFPHRWG